MKSDCFFSRKSCFVGFDAFIDCITRPIAGREGGAPRYFHDLEEYAAFLMGRNGKSFSVELEIPETRMGGNNPNMSGILSRCGVDVVSFGAYGKPALDPVFQPLAETCRLVSFANPGKCTAYEFTFSKMMNFYNMDPRDFTWENLLGHISLEEIAGLLQPVDLIIFVNLGEQPAVLNIMEMFLKHIFPRFTRRKRFFMDFSDCRHMTPGELSRSLEFVRNLRPFGEVILSVNENEYRVLSGHTGSGALSNVKPEDGTPKALEVFRAAAGADGVILRTLGNFYFSSPQETAQVPNAVVEKPRFLTGAGDAQNAGFCLGFLAGMSIEETLAAGVRAGNCYIRTGAADPRFIFEGVLP
ncbi:MAG: carbohydrate kinase family protein [Treponema sp.]|nr:carbohydrate kinase family protein [Treponema sp.]